MSAALRRRFTDDEKHAILAEASKRGIIVVLREHKLSYSVYSRWKEKFQIQEAPEKKSIYKIMQEIKNLTIENERLKRIIANQALEIQIKSEKLKGFDTM
jgi:putative transposase